MITIQTGLLAIGDIITGIAMALWIVLLVSPAVAMSVVIVGQKWNELTRKRLGLELEMVLKQRRDEGGSHHALATWLTLKGIQARTDGYNSPSSDVETKVQPDSSVVGNGVELVSPVLYDGDHEQWLRDVMKAMNGLAESSVSAGYHVHIGLRDYETQFGDEGQLDYDDAMAIQGRVIWAYGYFERKGFDMLVSASRRDGSGMSVEIESMTWANRAFPLESILKGEQSTETFDHDLQQWVYTIEVIDPNIKWQQVGRYSSNRYSKVNPDSLSKHGTIEFRQHQCINADVVKARRWANLCYDFVNRCIDPNALDDIEQYDPDINGLFDWLGFASSDSQRAYWTQRSRLLANKRLSQACSTCGSHRCMLDHNCPSDSDKQSQQRANQRAFESHCSSMQQPSYMSCNECGHEVHTSELYGVQYDPHWGWYADLAGYTCDYFGGDCDHDSYSMSAIGLGLMLLFPMMSAIALLVGCGIGAIHATGLPFKAKARLKKLFAKLVNRGSQASGYAYDKGNGVYYLKAAESSIALAPNMNKHIDSDVKWAMCHTRFATHGDKDDDNNAHPHFDSTGTVTLVHNGTIDNYLEAWPKLSVPRTGDVDSMVIAQAIYDGGIEKVVELLEGSMSLIWSDARDPTGTLKCWTNGGNDLHMGRLDDNETGHIVIASTEKHLKDTFGNRLVNDWAAYIGREYTIHPDGSISRRDIEGSADTYKPFNNRAWWTYGTTYGTTTIKATGQPDSCVIDIVDDGLHDAKDKLLDSFGGWPAFQYEFLDYHGYDILANQGIRPNGTRYDLPQYFDSNYWEDCDQLMQGELDPKVWIDYNW